MSNPIHNREPELVVLNQDKVGGVWLHIKLATRNGSKTCSQLLVGEQRAKVPLTTTNAKQQYYR
ncbi:hypothetical protein [Okeania sp. KiyG1]|uniref:hypothetical protein n=1 Tax=Okeania sp. KiyG1 TaxID=2720165 RepID=UPI00192293F7|nr:hypothetical protein [Okeania sp. KiyG1]